MFHHRTDLVLEATELWRPRPGDPGELPGVQTQQSDCCGYPRTTVRVLDEEGARAVGKPAGTYETLTLKDYKSQGEDAFPRAVRAVTACLERLLPPAPRGDVLVVGLGNRLVTPDAVGPRCTDHIMVTRHLKSSDPDLFAPFQPVAALAAGVLGTTGIESGELIRAVSGNLHPQAVVAVDALAARSVERLCTTIQITDTGITPGSGVGNARKPLDQAGLGVPVIAVGVPTVVDAATLAADLGGEMGGESPYASLLVTPKDVDTLVSDVAKILGYGINLALQPGMELSDVELFLS